MADDFNYNNHEQLRYATSQILDKRPWQKQLLKSRSWLDWLHKHGRFKVVHELKKKCADFIWFNKDHMLSQ